MDFKLEHCECERHVFLMPKFLINFHLKSLFASAEIKLKRNYQLEHSTTAQHARARHNNYFRHCLDIQIYLISNLALIACLQSRDFLP